MKCVHELKHMGGQQHNNKKKLFQHTKMTHFLSKFIRKSVNAMIRQDSRKICMSKFLYDRDFKLQQNPNMMITSSTLSPVKWTAYIEDTENIEKFVNKNTKNFKIQQKAI